jgi:predicted porin
MKHSKLAALSVLALAAGAACAQSSVTLYGVIDTGVERISNVGGTSSSLTRMPGQAGGILPSRWGVRGSEDLGGGTKVNFVLESGFSPDKGTNNTNQGGRLFGRAAWVGVSNAAWGSLSFGRQYTMYFWSLIDADAMGPAVYGLGSLDSGIPGARSDNTVAYKGTWAGFTAGATYSFGRDANGSTTGTPPVAASCAGETAGDYKGCKEYSALLKYDASMWGVAVAYDQQRGGLGGAAGFTGSSLTDTRRVVNGYVKLGPVKATAGLIKRNYENTGATAALTPKTDLTFVEADWAVTPAVKVTPLWSQLKYKDSSNGSKASILALRATYAFSKRTSVYALTGRMSNKGSANFGVSGGTIPSPADGGSTAPGAGRSQTGFMVGMFHSF